MTYSYYPGRPLAQEMMPDEGQHRRDIARVTNLAMRGQTNASLQVTLDPGTNITTVIDARISLQTAALPSPTTASAAVEIGNGTLWFTPTKGSLVIHHANSAVADRTFNLALVG